MNREPHAYRGGSMLGTLRRGDRIPIQPVPLAAIRPGDVVAFRAPNGCGHPEETVHRVMAVTPGGLVTRGDNGHRADNALVTADNLLGRVTCIERRGKRVAIRGGRAGLLRARLLHTCIPIRRAAFRLGRWPYRSLRRSGLVGRLWRPHVIRLCVATEEGPLVKYLVRGRTVARWWPAKGRFECQPPYDLVFAAPDDQSQMK
jgi:hypothetical protein